MLDELAVNSPLSEARVPSISQAVRPDADAGAVGGWLIRAKLREIARRVTRDGVASGLRGAGRAHVP